MEDLKTVIPNVAATLLAVAEFGLQAEVIAEALLFLKKHPEATITEALDEGYYNWIK